MLTTKYLDEASKDVSKDLEYFVTFSSISCGRGNRGQTNYGYANSIMERISEQRQKNGLPAVRIHLNTFKYIHKYIHLSIRIFVTTF